MMKSKPIDERKFRELYPFMSHYLVLKNGLKYHYLDEGAGEPVVMVHGNPTWSFYYRNLVTALSPQFRTVVPDHIGCGLSDKPSAKDYDYRLENRVADLTNLLDALAITDRINLVVHDWGGMIGMAYAVRHPERIARIVILNTAGFLMPKGKSLPMRLRVGRNLIPIAVPGILGLNLFALAALYMATAKGLDRRVRQGLIAPYNCWTNRIALLKFVQDIPLKPSDPSYGLVKWVDDHIHRLAHIPMLICWGMHDFVFDPDYLAEWQRRFPHAQVHPFNHAGHYVLEDAADEIVPIVKDFLKKDRP